MTTQLTIFSEKKLPVIISYEEKIERVKVFAKNQHSQATRTAYQSDINIFKSWCSLSHLNSLPSTPQTVALFLSEQAHAGMHVSTLSRRLVSIKHLHDVYSYDSPTSDKLVKATLKGIRRAYGVVQDKKAPATAEVISEMVRHIPNNLQGMRDRALLLLGFAGAFRRSELIALNVDDLQESEMGFKVTIRKSKTDQEGAGQVIAIYGGHRLKVVEAVKDWIEAAQIIRGPLFRSLRKGENVMNEPLSTVSVAQIIKKYVGLAGFNEADFSGHSLRSGFITSAADRGANIFKIMDVSRHRRIEEVKGYIRHVEIFKDHCGASFL